MLRIDINVLFTIINLIILYVLVRKFLFKPMNKILDQRKALIEQQFAEAAEKEQAADALKAQYEDSLKQASAEGAQIINDAKAKAKAESNTILEHANAAAAELMETTNAALDCGEGKDPEGGRAAGGLSGPWPPPPRSWAKSAAKRRTRRCTTNF